MIDATIQSIITLLFITPIIFLAMDRKKTNKWFLLSLFYAFFLLNETLLILPIKIPAFRFIEGHWNWSGKLYAILGSILFYLAFKKYFSQNDFFTLKQKEGSIKPNIIWIMVIIIVSILLGLFMDDKMAFSLETIGFELTLPGYDEEIAFRGIMIGILSTFLIDKIKFSKINFGNPAIWITAILFGLVHGFKITKNWDLQMDWIFFSYTFLFGFLLGWMTLKARSILLPVLSHNAANIFATLAAMLK